MDVINTVLTGLMSVLKWGFVLSARFIWWLLRALGNLVFRRRSTTFGSARWAKTSEIRRAGAFDGEGDGIIIGKYRNRLLRFNGEGAVMLYAPQGAGKGAGVIVPNLLEYKGAVFVTDPKGENYAKTKRQRRLLTGAPVYALNLQNIASSDNFNPLDMVRDGTDDEFDDAEALAGLMVMHDPKEPSHWADKAREKLAAMILHVCRTYQHDKRHLRTLATIRRECFSGRERLIAFLQEMKQSTHSRIAEEADDFMSSLGANPDSRGTGDEGSSILSKLNTATGVWSRDTGPGKISQKSDFNLLDVIDQGASVFVIVPEEKLLTMAPFLRVMLGLALYAVTRHRKERKQPPHKPLFVFDECAALGRLAALEQGMGYLRAYAKAILVFQDLKQLTDTYSKADSMMNGCACHVTFAVNDVKTSQELANRLGHTTVETRNTGQSKSSEELLRHQNQVGSGEAGRYLLDPAEIMRLGDKEALIFHRQVRWPIRAQRIEYWKEPRWRGLYDPWGDVTDFGASQPSAPTGNDAPASDSEVDRSGIG